MATNVSRRPRATRRAKTPEEIGIRALTAMLRWRLREMLERVPAPLASAMRFLPALLQASFNSPPLKGEAPGITGLKFRRRWSTLARVYGLPPPSSMQRAKAAVEALLVVPRGEGIEVIALVATELPPPARARVKDRLTAATAALGVVGRSIELRLVDLDSVDDETFESVISLGAVLAGVPPPGLFMLAHPQRGSALPLAARLAERAPTPLSALALMLMVGADSPSPIEVLRLGLADRLSCRALADPSLFCVRWAAQTTGKEELLMKVLRWSKLGTPLKEHGDEKPADGKPAPAAVPGAPSPTATARKPASIDLRSTSNPDKPTAGELLQVGREVTLLCARAILRCPLAESKGLRAKLRREVIGNGLPRALLPALAECKLRLLPTPVRVGREFQARLGDGTVLGRGRTPIQASIRANALITATGTPSDNTLAQRLSKGTTAPTLHLIVEINDVPGPPFDPLNRGPERQFGLLGSTALYLRANARPSAFNFTAEETVEKLAEAALAGREVEVTSPTPEGQPAAARLTRVATLLQKRGTLPVAIEAGGSVLLERAGRVRTVRLNRFARRPTPCTTDPEAYDLALSPERGVRNSGMLAIPGAIECRVFQTDAKMACVLSRDDRGRLLREEVALERVEEHLREGQELLRAGTPPTPIAARLAEGMEMLLLRYRQSLFALSISIGGELPFGLWVEVSEERIQVSRPGGWAAAAQAILAWLPVGDEPRLRIARTEITEKGEPACAISRLYVRAMALRRLSIHLQRQLALIDRRG